MTIPLDTTYITAENNLAVQDEQAIRQIVARLNHALDAADYPLYASFFSQDAVFNSAFGQATGQEQTKLENKMLHLREFSKFIPKLSNFKQDLLVPPY
jgi:DNA-binding GntR family transcriptional regulator